MCGKVWQIKFDRDDVAHQYREDSLKEKIQVKYNSDGSKAVSHVASAESFWDRVRDPRTDLPVTAKVEHKGRGVGVVVRVDLKSARDKPWEVSCLLVSAHVHARVCAHVGALLGRAQLAALLQ